MVDIDEYCRAASEAAVVEKTGASPISPSPKEPLLAMEDRLEFLTPRPGGGCAMGCSSLTGRCWSGSVWLYDDPLQAPDIAMSQASHQLHAGVPCAVWISRDILVVGEDGGHVEWLSTAEDPSKFTSLDSISIHTSYVSCLAVNSDSTQLITAGGDGMISVLDCNRQSKQVFCPAHASECCSVAYHTSDPRVFASTGLDGNVLIWDTRQEKPASGVHRNSSCPDTAVLWHPTSSGSGIGSLLIGSIGGSVRLHCTESRETLVSTEALSRRVAKFIPFESSSSSPVAVVGQQETVVVLDVAPNNISTLYTNSSQHSDIVSDVLWLSSKSLLSCGWDKSVRQHSLPS
ncbi:methylosome protein 50 [Hyalella azteca]|uniref:Methylosome protein 50 n=1 Tax=Hyalella azteca TaxID=294128 RepID=A0A8B7NAH9_HYAAZ|nr:methylosome protein 50 [Hyalella azteca]